MRNNKAVNAQPRGQSLTGITSMLVLSATMGVAGPIIIDGTDANDHGGTSGGANVNGWEYMQKALQNLASAVGNSNKKLVDLGTSAGQARNAINSAFGLSTLVGLGWSIVHIDGNANIATYLSGGSVSGTSLADTGILYLPTAGLSGGDLTSTELAAVNSGAAAIATFVAGGGGLFAMAESGAGAFGWLSTLIPGLVFTDVGGGGIGSNITLTPAGTTAFPGLTNPDMAGADPWHGYFSGNLGSLQVLGTALQGGNTRNLILGGGATATISTPDGGATIAMLGLALAGFAGFRRKLGA